MTAEQCGPQKYPPRKAARLNAEAQSSPTSASKRNEQTPMDIDDSLMRQLTPEPSRPQNDLVLLSSAEIPPPSDIDLLFKSSPYVGPGSYFGLIDACQC